MLLQSLNFFLLMACILGYALFLNRRWRWPIEITPLFTICCIIGLLYLSVYLNALHLTAQIIFLAGLAFALWESILIIKQRDRLLNVFTPGVCFYLLFAIIIWLKLHAAAVHTWDEFSHWGLFSKYLYLAQHYSDLNSPTDFKDYPPAGALFHYFAYNIIGYSEGTAYVAQSLMVITALLCLTLNNAWQTWRKALLIYFIALAIFFSFGPGFYSLYIDAVVSVFFGVAISVYYLLKNKTSAVIWLIPTIFILPLLKSIGALLAAITVLAVISNLLIENFSLKKPVTPIKSKKLLILLFSLIILPITLIASNYSWQNHIKQQNIPKTWNMHYSVTQIKNSFSPTTATAFDRTIQQRFFTEVATTKIDKGLSIQGYTFSSALFWSILLITIACLIYKNTRSKTLRIEQTCINVSLILGFLIYATGLLFLYLFSFGISSAAISTASYERYISIYFLGWCLVSYTLLNQNLATETSKTLKSFYYAFLIFILLGSASLFAFLFTSYNYQITSFRSGIQQIANATKPDIAVDKKIYVIWTDENSGPITMRYELLPINNTQGCWSVTTDPKKSRPFVCLASLNAFKQRVKNYDYLLLAKTNKTFWQEYGSLFKPKFTPQDWALYAIQKNGSNITFKLLNHGKQPPNMVPHD